VVQSDFQNIVGVVHIKDTVLSLISSPTNQAFLDVLRPTLYIEPTLKQDKIMRLFKEKRTHIAIVRDSNRGINLGIVTLEDILEELVGDIVDEHGN
jgi:putative hemolysin